MSDDFPKNLIPSPSSLPEIKKVDSLIGLTQDLMMDNIEQLFNTAFCLLNNKYKVTEGINFYHMFEKGDESILCDERLFNFNKVLKKSADDIVNSIICIDPNNYLAYILKGVASRDTNIVFDEYHGWNITQFGKINIEDFSRAITIYPKSIAAYFWRGFAYFQNKEYELASDDFSKVLEICPNIANAYYWLGNVKSELKDPEGAISNYSKVIELDPNQDRAFLKRGEHRQGNEDWDGAREDFTNAINANPNNYNAYENRAFLIMHFFNEWEEALADYTKGYEIQSTFEKDEGWWPYVKYNFSYTVDLLNSIISHQK